MVDTSNELVPESWPLIISQFLAILIGSNWATVFSDQKPWGFWSCMVSVPAPNLSPLFVASIPISYPGVNQHGCGKPMKTHGLPFGT